MGSDLKIALETEMEKMKQANRLARGDFVSDKYLDKLFTIKNLKGNLRPLLPPTWMGFREPMELGQLANNVRNSAQRLYAILLLMDQSPRIIPLLSYDPPVDDKFLFGSPDDPKDNLITFCSLKRLLLSPLEDIAEEFYNKQWHCPPQLSDSITHEFPPDLYIYPFTGPPINIGGGGYGAVQKVDIAKGYLEHPNAYQNGVEVAYKRIRTDFVANETKRVEMWERLKIEVSTLRARQHKNVTPLFASFFAGMESQQNSPQDCLYIISPCAQMNMREWMLKRPPYIKKYEEEGTLRKHIFDSMLDLATGVAFIHREISGKVGYHRDIKPENILLFNKPDRPEFTWKICDFGCANLKSIDRTGTLNLRTDPHWAPPEVIGATEEGYSETRGRAHDVYSLGCIFVLLATFLIYGWEPAGLAIFNKRRQEYVGNGDDVDINGPECAFHCTMNVARGWIAELPPEAPNDLRGQIEALIVLIGEMVRPIEERIYSWEVEVDLHMIIHPDLSELALLQILKEAIQSSRTLNHGIKHNPMRRAKEARKPQSFLKMLEDAKWYDHTPGSTEELKRRKADVSKYHSTLKAPPYEDSLFGFQKLDQRIAELFASKVDSVALYGLGGMGKSSMAHYYASQCKDIENKEAKRHTFWVNATTITSMKESYQEILAAITPSELNHVLDDNTKCLEVKKWLEDDSNGFWMLVVDGFDSPKDAAQIESFLPKQGSGQILYTTRNRARVKHLVQLNRGAAIQVERPENSDCLRIFRRYLDPILAGNPQQTATLLEYLWCPQVIKETATRMNNEHMSVMELLVDLKDNSHLSLRANFVEHFRKDLLRPLLETVDDFSKLLKNPPRAIQILSHLAFFHEEGVDMEILKAGFKQDQYRDEYRPTLTILQDCCLVDHIETRDDESYIKKYILRNPIRSIILAWIEREEGALGLLKRYNVVLSTLYFYYEESKKSDIESEDGRKSKQPLSSHKSRLPLMPHFAQFVKFVTVRARRNLKVEFELDNVAIRAIANFSRALVDQGRHGEAERVLEFARRHYFSDTNRDDDTKARRKDIIWFRLGQQLVKTYLSRPKGQSPQPNLVKAEKLALALYTDAGAKAAGTNSLKWAGSKVLKWECLLDLVRVYWESDQIEKASKELQTMRMIKVCVDKGKATLPEHAELPDILARTDLNEGELARIQNLSLKVRYEEGLLFLAEGEKFTKQKELERARQSWSAARKAFEDVLIAIKEWFGDDHPWLNDVRVSLADAIIKGASPQNLHQAERALDAAHQNILVEFGRNSRKVWSIERKLNAARLSLGDAGHAAQVEISSRRLLQAFEQSDLRDREAVEHCAEHLRDALIRLGRRAEAQNLSERFSNLPQLAAVVPNNWKLRQRRAVLILVSLICISCFLFAMWTMIGTDSWHLSQD